MRVFITVAIILGSLQAVEGQYVLTPVSLSEYTKSTDGEKHDPMISPEGDRLVFGSTLKSHTAYYQISRNEEGWTTPELIKNFETFNRPGITTYAKGFNGKSLFFSSTERQKKNKYTHAYYRLNLIDNDFGIPFKVDVESGVGSLGNPHKAFLNDGSEHYFDGDQKLIKTIPNALPNEFGSGFIGILLPIAAGENAVLFQKIDPKKKFKLRQEELFFSYRQEDKWSHPNHLIMKGLESKVIANYSFSEKTKEIFFSTKNGEIYYAKIPRELAEKISTDYLHYSKPLASKTTSPDPKEIKSKYYALLIGIENYQNNNSSLIDLSNPVEDAESLKAELATNYYFKPENIRMLRNPDRADIINSFENISTQVTEEDNLLIFYAGHGYWNEKLKIGYWLPADATADSKANWISNSTVRDYIAGLNTKHTLLISDACFSGSIFKAREVTKSIDDYGYYRLNKLPSRKAMTSGTLNTVPDESKFMKYLLKALSKNEKEYLPSKQLFHEIEIAIINNTTNIPQFGTIQNTGDEGGDFIFKKKNKDE